MCRTVRYRCTMQGVYCVGLYVSDAHSKSIVLVSQSVCLSVCLFVCLSVCLTVCLFFFLYVRLSNSVRHVSGVLFCLFFCQFRMHHASEQEKKAKGVECVYFIFFFRVDYFFSLCFQGRPMSSGLGRAFRLMDCQGHTLL